MREPVVKRRPLIDVDEFERRLRQPSATNRIDNDPLIELARLPGGGEDPYKNVFEPVSRQLAEPWDENARMPLYPQETHDAQESRSAVDFAAIEAGLLGAGPHDFASQQLGAIPGGPNQSEDFIGDDLGSDHWRHEDGPELPYSEQGGDDEIRSKRPLYLMGAIIVVGIVGIGASFAFKGSVSGPREIATIRAADGPVRFNPKRPPPPTRRTRTSLF